MWRYCRMWSILWLDKITDAEVLNKMQQGREIINVIRKEEASYLGHTTGGPRYSLLQLIINGKRSIGR